MWTGFVIGDRGLGASGDTHPAWMMAYAVTGPYLVVGASAIGQIHLARGAPRDDAFVIRSVGPWLAVTVADGVGSRPLSRYGATYVTEALSALLLRPLILSSKTGERQTDARPEYYNPMNLAPPSTSEEIELSPPIVKRGNRRQGLRTGLTKWNNKALRTENRILASDDPPLSLLQQAASVGWWPLQGGDKSTSDRNSLPKHPQPAEAAESESLAKPSEPNTMEIMRQAFVKVHQGLREHARSLALELTDLSCTALALLVNLETGHGAAGQIGDGAILGLTAKGKVQALVQSPDTEDPQATYTLNKPNFEQYLAMTVWERASIDPYVAFYVMTDGLSGDLLYSPQTGALMTWAKQVDHNLRISSSPAQAAAGMLNWLATYQVKGSWDDRTLVVVTRRERNDGSRDIAAEQPEPAEPTVDQ